jgi:magnesium-transporting ATPase (P-type)
MQVYDEGSEMSDLGVAPRKAGQTPRQPMSGTSASSMRWSVFARVMAAIIGAYVLTLLSIAVLALVLPMSRAESVLLSMLLSFLIYACAVLWVFATRSAWRAWCGMLLPSLLMAAGLGLWWSLK